MSNARPGFFRSALALAISSSILFPLAAEGDKKKLQSNGWDYHEDTSVSKSADVKKRDDQGFDISTETLTLDIPMAAPPRVSFVEYPDSGTPARCFNVYMFVGETAAMTYDFDLKSGQVTISRNPHLPEPTNRGNKIDTITGLATHEALKDMVSELGQFEDLQAVDTGSFVEVEKFSIPAAPETPPFLKPLMESGASLDSIHGEVSLTDTDSILYSMTTAWHKPAVQGATKDSPVKKLHERRLPVVRVRREKSAFVEASRSKQLLWEQVVGDTVSIYRPASDPQTEALIESYLDKQVQLKYSQKVYIRLRNNAHRMQMDVLMKIDGTGNAPTEGDVERIRKLQQFADLCEFASGQEGATVTVKSTDYQYVESQMRTGNIVPRIKATFSDNPVINRLVVREDFTEAFNAIPTYTGARPRASDELKTFVASKTSRSKAKLDRLLEKAVEGAEQDEALKRQYLAALDESERTKQELTEHQRKLEETEARRDELTTEMTELNQARTKLEEEVKVSKKALDDATAELPDEFKGKDLPEAVQLMSKAIEAKMVEKKQLEEEGAPKPQKGAEFKIKKLEAEIRTLKKSTDAVTQYLVGEEARLELAKDKTLEPLEKLPERVKRVSDTQKTKKIEESNATSRLLKEKKAVDDDLTAQKKEVDRLRKEEKKQKQTLEQLTTEIEEARTELKAKDEETLGAAVKRTREAHELSEFNINEVKTQLEELKEKELTEELKTPSPTEKVEVGDKQAVPPEDQLTKIKELEDEVTRLTQQVTQKEKEHKDAMREHQEEVQKATHVQLDKQAKAHKEALGGEKKKTQEEVERANGLKTEVAQLKKDLEELQKKPPVDGAAPPDDQGTEITRLQDEKETAVRKMEQTQRLADENLKKLQEAYAALERKLEGMTPKPKRERRASMTDIEDLEPVSPEELQGKKPPAKEVKPEAARLEELGGDAKQLQAKVKDLLGHLRGLGVDPGATADGEALLAEVEKMDLKVQGMIQQLLVDHLTAKRFGLHEFQEIAAKAHIARFLEAQVRPKFIKMADQANMQGYLRGDIPIDVMDDDSFNRAYYGLINIEVVSKPLGTLVDEVVAMDPAMRQLYSTHSSAVSAHSATPKLSIRLQKARRDLYVSVAELVLRGRVDLDKLEQVLHFYAVEPAKAIHPDQGFWDRSGLSKNKLLAYLELANTKSTLDFQAGGITPEQAFYARLRAAGVSVQWLRDAKAGSDLPELSESSITHGAIRQTVKNAGVVLAFNRLNFILDDIAYCNGQNIIQAVLGTAEDLDQILYLAGLTDKEKLAHEVVVWLGSTAAAVWEQNSRDSRFLQFAGSLLPAAALMVQPIIDPRELTYMYTKMGPAAYTREVWASMGAFLAVNFLIDFSQGAQGTTRMIQALDPAARQITGGLTAMVDYVNQYLYVDETYNPDEAQYFMDSWLALMKNWNGFFDFVGRHARAGRFAGDWAQYSANTIIYGRAIGTPLLQRYGWVSDHPGHVKQLLLAAGIGGGAMLIDTFMYDMPLNNFQYTRERLAGPAEWLDWAQGYRPVQKGSWSYAIEHELPKYSLNHPESYYKGSKAHQQYRAVMDVVNKGYEQATLRNTIYVPTLITAFVAGHLVVKPAKTLYNYVTNPDVSAGASSFNDSNSSNDTLGTNWADARGTGVNLSNSSEVFEGIDLSDTVRPAPSASLSSTERPGPALTPVDSGAIPVDSSVITPSAPGTTSVMPSDMTTASTGQSSATLQPKETMVPEPPQAKEEPSLTSPDVVNEQPLTSNTEETLPTEPPAGAAQAVNIKEPPAQKEEPAVVETVEQKQMREMHEKLSLLSEDDDE